MVKAKVCPCQGCQPKEIWLILLMATRVPPLGRQKFLSKPYARSKGALIGSVAQASKTLLSFDEVEVQHTSND